MLPNKFGNKLPHMWPVWKDSDTSCRTCCSTCVQC